MINRRRKDRCENCGYFLADIYNYCPRCGQENNDKNISFGTIVKESVQNYFSLDSRFGKSVKPFLFKPGFLTREFITGKRVSYANPIRLYLLLSLFFFFVLTTAVNYLNRDTPRDVAPIQVTASDRQPQGNSDGSLLSRASTSIDWAMIDSIRFDQSYTDRQLIDSMNLPESGFLERKLRYQMIKLYRTDAVTFQQFLVSNLPVMMVFVIPIFGWWLRVFFGYRGKLYIHHLIHSIHIHSFAYLIYGLTLIGMMLLIDSAVIIYQAILAVAIILVYSIISLKNFYGKSWITTIFRSLVMGLSYTISFVVFLFIEIVLSMLLF